MLNQSAYRYIGRRTKGHRIRIALLVVGNILFAAMSVFISLACRGIIDGATAGKKQTIIVYGVGLLCIFLVQLFLRLGCNSLSEYIKAKMENDYRNRILLVLFQKEYEGVAHFHSGELLNRMFSDVQIIVNGIVDIVPNLLNMLTRLVGAVSVLIVLDRSFVFVFLCAGAVVFLVTRVFRGMMKRMHKDVQEKEGKVRSFLQETVESFLIVKVFGAERQMMQKNRVNQQAHFKSRMKRRTASIFANAGFSFVFEMGYLYAIVWGAGRILQGAMSYGTLTAILQLVNQVQMPFAQLSGILPQLYSVLASAERIIELEELPVEKWSVEGSSMHELMKGRSKATIKEIQWEQVCFSYGRMPVLKDVTVIIQKGDFVAIKGLSGGGKSTMFLLLLGAYHPQSGSIRFLLEDGRRYTPGAGVRSLFAYVPQGNYLFSGTIYENVTFLYDTSACTGRDGVKKPNETTEIDEKALWGALEEACADKFVRELPQGLQTVIGEKGHGLSEGQVQRIAVARALLSQAPILLLDEATSALDEATEAKLLANLSKDKERTCLIVTHRKAALELCDYQLVLEDGVVQRQEQGK